SATRLAHLEKNRLAAHKCRQKKKQWVQDLEAQGRELTAMHAHLKEHVATLREQVLMLKNELFVHANCGCWEIDRYLERVAGEMIGRGM
ncbi:hypothetical protein K432DRAFT_258023, partial [Lepidopterella palustris CBS 459.81]